MEDELFTLNDTGKAIWDQFDGRRSLAGVVAAETGQGRRSRHVGAARRETATPFGPPE